MGCSKLQIYQWWVHIEMHRRLCCQLSFLAKMQAGRSYRMTQHVGSNLPLTSKQKFCFCLARSGQVMPKRNLCFDVNGRFEPTCCVTLYIVTTFWKEIFCAFEQMLTINSWLLHLNRAQMSREGDLSRVVFMEFLHIFCLIWFNLWLYICLFG